MVEWRVRKAVGESGRCPEDHAQPLGLVKWLMLRGGEQKAPAFSSREEQAITDLARDARPGLEARDESTRHTLRRAPAHSRSLEG